MVTSNPLIILRELNKHLANPLELTLIGRAALNLGFDPPIGGKNTALTHDVDIVVTSDQEKELDQNEDFWTALEKTNNNLKNNELYLSHIFIETQIILSKNWQERKIKIDLPELNKITLYRPSCVDLMLTKMARANDPEDRKDILEIIQRGKLTRTVIEEAFKTAKYPDAEDLIEQVKLAKQFIRSHYRKSVDQPNTRETPNKRKNRKPDLS